MGEGTIANTEQARYWDERAESWLSAESIFEFVATGVGRAAMDRLSPTPGMRVLDVGCGSGVTTVELAERVGAAGAVLGVDIAEPLLARARERTAEAGLGNVTYLHADAQVHDLGEGAHDAAYSRFGVMFFADPVAAFANLRRALRPGGPLSFVCWQAVFANEWMTVPAIAAMQVLGVAPQPPEPGAPGPFSLAEPERVHAVLEAAGWRDVVVEPHADTVSLSESEIAPVAGASTNLRAVQSVLTGADAETERRVADAVEAALRDRLVDGEVRLARSVLLVTARA